MSLISAQVTILNPFGGSEGQSWRSGVDRHIRESFETADEILGARDIHVRQCGPPAVIDTVTSQQMLTRDIRLMVGPDPAAYQRAFNQANAEGEQRYRELRTAGIEAPHHRHSEYFVNTGLSYGVGTGLASGEALEILRLTRRNRCVAVYWVPGISGATALSLYRPFYSNVGVQEEGILMRPGTGPDTLAHEIGHLLMRCGHCSEPDDDSHAAGCECAGPDNLMHGSGDVRAAPTGRLRLRQFFTREQAVRLRREAAQAGYLAA